MRKTLLFFIAAIMVLSSCAHGPAGKRGVRSMYYAHPPEEVLAATKTVLIEQEYEITEINMAENFIRAIKGATDSRNARLPLSSRFGKRGKTRGLIWTRTSRPSSYPVQPQAIAWTSMSSSAILNWSWTETISAAGRACKPRLTGSPSASLRRSEGQGRPVIYRNNPSTAGPAQPPYRSPLSP